LSALTRPQEALRLLKQGGLAMGPEWRQAHDLCQQQEGDPAHDLVHALVHWIEGDEGNAGYWYRRTGGGRTETIETEWERIAAKLAER
jgi:hypothetical protein